jgi:hypothetical protein
MFTWVAPAPTHHSLLHLLLPSQSLWDVALQVQADALLQA